MASLNQPGSVQGNSTDVPELVQASAVPRSRTRTQRDPAVSSRIMSRVRSKNSVAEMAVRRRLWAAGLRYRLGAKLAGKPDIVFLKQRLAVFIDGDFWHGNAWRVRGQASFEAQFVNRSAWWSAKIRRNMARDQQITEQLDHLGWRVLRFWESAVLADPAAIVG